MDFRTDYPADRRDDRISQDKIWDYFQNSKFAEKVFPEARQRFVLRFLIPGTKVLNIGVGAGALERLGIKKGVEMWSLDPSRKAIDRLRDSLAMGDRAQAGYVQDIPFAAGGFDAVVMSEVLEHLENAVLHKGLEEVWRVLKPNGVLIATVPYREDLDDNQVVCPDCGHVFHKVGHVQSFDKEKMRQLLSEKQFVVERIWVSTFIDWRRKGLFSFFKSVLRWLLARMGQGIADPHLVVIARKP